MKIYCIVMYASIKSNQIFFAAENNGLREEPHLQKIQDNLNLILLSIKGQDGLHTLFAPTQIYYAYLRGDKLAIAATDEALSPNRLHAFFERICLAEGSNALQELIANPDQAVESKADLIQEKLEETKEVLLETIEKMLERENNLKQLVEKTQVLAAESFSFFKRSTDAKK